MCWELGYQIHAQPSGTPMQLCTETEAYAHSPTAAECRDFALTRAGESDGVQAQIDAGTLTASSVGACIFNSGGTNKWQLLATTTLGPICDFGLSGGHCACIPEEEYITIDGTSLSGNSPVQLNFDTYDYPGQTYHGQAFTPALCCQLCSQTAAPSAPPSPPQLPTSPSAPPWPPGEPPPPPIPGYPPGTNVVAAQSSSGPGISLSGDCKAIVITDDGYCHLYNRNIIKRHSDESSGCTTTGCSNVKGRSVYAINNPPPPPMLPSSAACRPFTPHRDEKIMDTYKLEVTPVSTADPDSECTTLNPHTQLVTTLYP